MVRVVRALLIVQAAGGLLALAALSALLLLEVAFGAFTIALLVLVAWGALVVAIAVAVIGQSRLLSGSGRWRWILTGHQGLVVFVGLALEAYLLVPTRFGVPPPPALTVVLVLVLPALAAVNIALLIAAGPKLRAA